MVPDEFYTETVHPTRLGELSALLLAASYWHFQRVPVSAIMLLWCVQGAFALPERMAADVRNDIAGVHQGTETPLQWAIRHDCPDDLQYIVENTPDIARRLIFLPTTLSFSCKYCAIDTCSLLVLCAEARANACFAKLLPTAPCVDIESPGEPWTARCAELFCQCDNVTALELLMAAENLQHIAFSLLNVCSMYGSVQCLRLLDARFSDVVNVTDAHHWVYWNCAAHGHIECLRAAYGIWKAKVKWSYDVRRKDPFIVHLFQRRAGFAYPLYGGGDGVIYAAARTGNLDCLRFLMAENFPRGIHLCTGAAQGGHLHVLRFLHEEQSLPLRASAVNLCATEECLSYLLEHGCPFYVQEACLEHARRNDVACLQLLHAAGGDIGHEAAWAAAEVGAVKSLKFMVHHCGVDLSTCDGLLLCAASAEDEDCVAFLKAQNCKWSVSDCLELVEKRSSVGLDLALAAGAPASSTVAAKSARYGRLDMLQCLVKYGKPLARSACRGACYAGNLPCLRFLRKHGCEWDAGCLKTAFERNYSHCIAYLLDNGCPAPSRGLACCHRTGSTECCLSFILAKQRAPLLSRLALSRAAAAGHDRCIEELLHFARSHQGSAPGMRPGPSPVSGISYATNCVPGTACVVAAVNGNHLKLLCLLFSTYRAVPNVSAAAAACRNDYAQALGIILESAVAMRNTAAILAQCKKLKRICAQCHSNRCLQQLDSFEIGASADI